MSWGGVGRVPPSGVVWLVPSEPQLVGLKPEHSPSSADTAGEGREDWEWGQSEEGGRGDGEGVGEKERKKPRLG